MTENSKSVILNICKQGKPPIKRIELSPVLNWTRQRAERFPADSKKAISKQYSRGRRNFKKTFSKKKNQRKAIYASSLIAILILFSGLMGVKAHADNTQYQLQTQIKHRQVQVKKLNSQLQEVKQEKTQTDAELQTKAQHEADLQKQIDDLNQQLQAKRDAQAAEAAEQARLASIAPVPEAPAPVAVIETPKPVAVAPIVEAPAPRPVARAVVSGCGDNSMANYIYMHESGCNTGAMNAGGCFGIGQDCNGIVLSRCGADYACQNEYFTNYANSRYGGWYGAYAFWQSHSWW